jgi:hypothetical protein
MAQSFVSVSLAFHRSTSHFPNPLTRVAVRSPGLEAWLRLPALPLSVQINFAWGNSDLAGTPGGVISCYPDPSGRLIYNWRDLPQSMTDWMQQNSIQFNANVHEFDLGCEGAWMLLTGTIGGYDASPRVEGMIKNQGGNVLRSVCRSFLSFNCCIYIKLICRDLCWTKWLPIIAISKFRCHTSTSLARG